MSTSPLARAARTTTAPIRNFFNQHFEMVKDEVRATGVSEEVRSLVQILTDLESDLLETSLHHVRTTTNLRREVADLNLRLASLERSVDRLSEVVAASLHAEH